VLAECGAGLHCNEIQEGLCDAVNNLVKHFYKPEKEASDYLSFFCNVFNDFYCREDTVLAGMTKSTQVN